MSALLLASACAVLACQDDAGTTSVRLSVFYPQPAPALLRLSGQTQHGLTYGPSMLPDPARPLSPAGETVIVQLPAAAHGTGLELEVIGLDAQQQPRMRGRATIALARGTLRDVMIKLAVDPPCERGGPRSIDGTCPPAVTDEPQDAGVVDLGAADAGTIDAGSLDASMLDVNPDEGGILTGTPDAGCTDASCDPSLEEPLPEPEPPRCGDGQCDEGEDACNCTGDCGASTCGDGICCEAARENGCNCAADCPEAYCGDGICCGSQGENALFCLGDCLQLCGDGLCTGDEDPCTCAWDCEFAVPCRARCRDDDDSYRCADRPHDCAPECAEDEDENDEEDDGGD